MPMLRRRSLPNRQLRKYRPGTSCDSKSSLPNRQLRNPSLRSGPFSHYSLPNRQLRKQCVTFYSAFPGSLPNRQLRKAESENLGAMVRSLPNRQLRKTAQPSRRCRSRFVPATQRRLRREIRWLEIRIKMGRRPCPPSRPPSCSPTHLMRRWWLACAPCVSRQTGNALHTPHSLCRRPHRATAPVWAPMPLRPAPVATVHAAGTRPHTSRSLCSGRCRWQATLCVECSCSEDDGQCVDGVR